MKKILSAVVIGLLMIFSYIAGWHHKARVATATANDRRVLYWVDPMHPDYKSDHSQGFRQYSSELSRVSTDIDLEQTVALKDGAIKSKSRGEVQEFAYFSVRARAVSAVFFPTLTVTATSHLGCIDAGTLSAA